MKKCSGQRDLIASCDYPYNRGLVPQILPFIRIIALLSVILSLSLACLWRGLLKLLSGFITKLRFFHCLPEGEASKISIFLVILQVISMFLPSWICFSASFPFIIHKRSISQAAFTCNPGAYWICLTHFCFSTAANNTILNFWAQRCVSDLELPSSGFMG